MLTVNQLSPHQPTSWAAIAVPSLNCNKSFIPPAPKKHGFIGMLSLQSPVDELMPSWPASNTSTLCTLLMNKHGVRAAGLQKLCFAHALIRTAVKTICRADLHPTACFMVKRAGLVIRAATWQATGWKKKFCITTFKNHAGASLVTSHFIKPQFQNQIYQSVQGKKKKKK